MLLFQLKKSNQNSSQNKLAPLRQYFDSHRHRDVELSKNGTIEFKRTKRLYPMKERLERRLQEELDEGNQVIAYTLLVDYFESVVAPNPSTFPEFLAWRKKIKQKRHRPCMCKSDLSAESLQTFFKNLKTNLWDLITDKAKPKRLKDASDYKAEPEDKKLESLVKPIAGTDALQMNMLGINFDSYGITATNAIMLLFLPKVKKGKKGVFCMTRKCFKENNDELILDVKFPDYKQILPNIETPYRTFELNIDDFRKLIYTLEANGFTKEGMTQLHFIYDDQIISIDAFKRFLPALETFKKLGEEKVKIWIHAHNKAIVLTKATTKLEELADLKTPFVLFMPVQTTNDGTIKDYMDGATYGSPIYDLDEQKLSFMGSKAKGVPIRAIDKTKLLQIAKAKSKARLRVLQLKAVAA